MVAKMIVGLALTCGHRWGFVVLVMSACWFDNRCADAGDPSAHDPGS